MNITQVKEISRILTAMGSSNKELQAHVLGYVVGVEAPLNLNIKDADDELEWNSFFNDIPGEINEHFVINLSLAQDVANLTLLYRQAVANGTDQISLYAKRFIDLTGVPFGMFYQEGAVNLIRKQLKTTVEQARRDIAIRREARSTRTE